MGNIPNTPDALNKLAGKLADKGGVLRFCYEAGPCGYGVWRHLRGLGHDCVVVAPSLIPRTSPAIGSRPTGATPWAWRNWTGWAP